jgi:transposase InsO family protein
VLRILELNRSNYYEWKEREPSKQKMRKQEITTLVGQIYYESHEIFGAPKIAGILREMSHVLSTKYVGDIMRENGWRAHYVKPYVITTKNCDFTSKLKNVLNRHFNPDTPNAVWVTDITYVWTKEDGYAYLTSVMDLYSRKIIAWTLSDTMRVEDVLRCIKVAKKRREFTKALILHSDRGSQFTSGEYFKLTTGMTTSFSDKGNPWDNACIEAFHALIKREWFKKYQPVTFQHAYDLTFEYIEGFYNTVRPHTHCDGKSPNEFEKQFNLRKRTA